jgi:hypothetical protein
MEESRGRVEWGGALGGIIRLVRLGIKVFLTELILPCPSLASSCFLLLVIFPFPVAIEASLTTVRSTHLLRSILKYVRAPCSRHSDSADQAPITRIARYI